jgi:hypothetical protein
MSAINFVVRDSAGNLQRGFLGGDTESNVLNAGAGNDISLNLRRSQVLDYAREGNDLIITLSDGRELTLSNYFPNGVEAQNELYLSADGFMNEVALIDDPVDGLRAQYIPKLSYYSSLYYALSQPFEDSFMPRRSILTERQRSGLLSMPGPPISEAAALHVATIAQAVSTAHRRAPTRNGFLGCPSSP